MNPKNLSIRGKLYLLSGTAAAVALLLASIAFSYQHISTFRQNTVTQLRSVGEVLAANTIAAITFDDKVAASEVLASLQRNEDITASCIFSKDGNVFASYIQDGTVELSPFPSARPSSHNFDSAGTLEMFVDISDGDESHGTLYLRSSMAELYRSLSQYAVMVALVFVVALFTSLIFSSRLQRVIAVPIRELAETAEMISENNDYSIRVKKQVNDEIGTLYDAFNDMLKQIETSENHLIAARTNLEERVEERTSQLTASHAQLTQEMEEKQKMQRRLIDASRQAGMAEVATGVLHNVGNILNSVNVSANLVHKKIQSSRLPSLVKLADVINEHIDDLPEFAASKQGSLLPRMLEQLAISLQEEKESIAGEVSSLQTNIDHIKKIVSAQQSFGSTFGVTESLNVSEILNDAINICGGSLHQKKILIERVFEDMPDITIDRHQLMQILVNLVRNATQSVQSARKTGGKVVFHINLEDDDFVSIQVVDNGLGIDADTLPRIFTHGFTTKKEGHGFGLHSSALAAKEMGGSLDVESDGLNCGARFKLRIPTFPISKRTNIKLA